MRYKAVRDAANTAVEKLEPLVYKEILTIHIDQSLRNKDESVKNLATMGGKAKAAVPMLKGYHNLLFKGNEGKCVPATTMVALIRIIPEDENLQREVLKLVASDPAYILMFQQRKVVIDLMNEMPIENKLKYTALMTAISRYPKERALLIAEVAKLGADAKAAIPIFKALKTDPDQAVRDAAAAAILKINE